MPGNNTSWTTAPLVPGGGDSAVDGAGGGEGYQVEQGPEWLAEWFVAPPEWMLPALLAIAIGVIVLAVWALARQDDLETELLEEIVANGYVAAACLVGAHVSSTFLALPYLADVAIGALVGVVCWWFADAWARGLVARLDPDGFT